MIKPTELSYRLRVLLAFASVAILTPVVHAATITPAMNDLILGFRATSNPGQTLNLEVDLGSMSQFYNATPGQVIALPSLSVNDLNATFGSSWFTRTDLSWGAVATTGRAAGTPDSHAPVGTLWATAPDGTPAWNRGNVFAQKNASATLEAMIVPGALGTLYGATSTVNSPNAAVIDATIAGSWTVQDLKTAGTSFGYFNPTVDSSANVPSGGQVVAQLYELQPSSTSGQPSTLLGNLVLTRTGLSFHAAGGSAAPGIGVSGNLTFGSIATGTTATATLTITNTGAATLTVTNITYPNGFSGPFSGAIATGSATNVTVTFTPVAIASYSGTVTINNNAASGSNTIFASGSGSAAALNPTKIIGLSGNLTFGNVTTGATATAMLTITNAGNSTLTVNSISYPDGFSGAFSGPIAAGSAQGVLVTFAPVAVVSYSGTVTVTSDATSGSGTSAASGAGIAAGVVLTKIIGLSGNLTFGTVSTGGTATATLTITNAGNSTLTVNSISYPDGFSGAFSGPIAAGSAQGVIVTFAPAALSDYTGTVTVNSDATGGLNTLAVSGTGGTPTWIIGLSGNLAFGNVPMGSIATATLTITNAGNSTLTVSSITYPAGFSGAFSGPIAVGTAQRVTVTFVPAALASYSGLVTVNSDATSGPSTIAASGAGILARIIGLSGKLAFGNVLTGTTATATMTITNAGNVTLTVTNLTYPPSFKGPFSGTIAPGNSVDVAVIFTSRALISHSGNITVHSDATSGPNTIAVSGTGVATAPTRILGLSGNLAFGNVTTGATATATLTITNAGNSTLTISSIAYPAGFSGASGGTIAAGTAVDVTVTFAPTLVSNYGGTVTVHSDATSGLNTMAASGTGGVRIIGLSGNLDFGNVPMGTTATATLTITNAGNSTLTITSIAYPAGFSGAFSGSIVAGGTLGLIVTFTPAALTNYSGTVIVHSDATVGNNTLVASGTGGTPTRVIGLSGNLAFGNVTTGTTATATVTITNAGNSTLAIINITYPTGFSGASSGTIAAGNSLSLTVTFAPVALSNYNGTVTVTSDATSGFNTIAASGAGVMPVATRILGLSGNLVFGSVPMGATATATLTITNAGNSTLAVSGINYPAGFSGAFSGPIAAGGAQSVTVTFAPMALSGYSGSVTVSSDATSGTSTLAASGTGIATHIIGLSGNLVFGSVATGTTTTATMTITNAGNSTLMVSGITYPAGFSGAFSGAIAAGSAANVTVVFAPKAPISYNWIVSVSSDATAGISTLVASGTGFVPPVNHPPVFTTGPSITNALAVINGNFVIVPGETNNCLVSALDPDGNPVTYQWIFGDGVTNAPSPSALADHAYAAGECGSYAASVTVSDGSLTTTSNLTVIAACQLTITKMQIALNFAKPNLDKISLTAKLDLAGLTNVAQLAGVSAVVDVGDAQVPFRLLTNKGRGVSSNGTCVLVYTKPNPKKGTAGFWTATINLSKGTWHTPLAKYGLTGVQTIKKPVPTLPIPVVVLIGNEAAAAEKPMSYTATQNNTGTAK